MRFLLNAATVLSLLTCAAAAILWPWSYYESHCLRYAPRRDGFEAGAYADSGYVCFWRDKDGVFDSPGRGIQYWRDDARASIPRGDLRIVGVVFRVGTDAQWDMYVPMWYLALSLGLLPAFRAARWWFHRSDCAGSCRSCGYDLRATPEQCPECGTIPAR